mmetsp:Transcript_17137/g.15113  ORF Transcript_17137/g.15113 Transcript_17137/m.15113 type:complete len:81 (+) Transcript_17137:8-250(+)
MESEESLFDDENEHINELNIKIINLRSNDYYKRSAIFIKSLSLNMTRYDTKQLLRSLNKLGKWRKEFLEGLVINFTNFKD